MDVATRVQVIRKQKIVNDRVEDLIDVSGRCKQADLLNPLDGIFFRLLFPHALGYNWGRVSRGVALIFDGLRRVDKNLRELFVLV